MKKNQNDILILMYHRILPRFKHDSWIEPGMYVSVESFAAHLKFIKSEFNCISLSEIFQEGIFKSKPCENKKPLCALTFDDGWKDFYKHAYPLLKKENLSSTVFLPTSYIGTEDWFWTDKLLYIFNKAKEMKLDKPTFGGIDDSVLRMLSQLDIYDDKSRDGTFVKLKGLPNEVIFEKLKQIADAWQINDAPSERAFLNWNEVKEMHKSGLVFFGSHTATHPILTNISPLEIVGELDSSKADLIREKVVDPLTIPFCYPNGNHNAQIASQVREAGYSIAVTTKTGWNTNGSDRFILKRVGLHEDMAWPIGMFVKRLVS